MEYGLANKLGRELDEIEISIASVLREDTLSQQHHPTVSTIILQGNVVMHTVMQSLLFGLAL